VLTAVGVNGPAHGTLALNADGSFTYTPEANFVGFDSFTYKASDGSLFSDVVTVTIKVNAVNHAPVANQDSYTVNMETRLDVAAAGILANDTDRDNNALTATLVSGVAHGTLSLSADGSFSYTPATNFIGTDSFSGKFT
jgi:VCBS repeat-containing protein